MAISPVTVTFSLYDFLGFVPDTRRTKVVLTTNVASGFIADTSTGGGFRITDTRVTISSTGVASFSVLPSGATGLNPAAYQIRVQIDAANPATRQRAMVDLGYYTITAACDLKDLVAAQYVPPTYLSTVTTALDAKVTAAAGSATAAAGSATAAAASAATAVSVSGISTPDGVVAALVPLGGATTAALSASIALAVEPNLWPANVWDDFFAGRGSTDDPTHWTDSAHLTNTWLRNWADFVRDIKKPDGSYVITGSAPKVVWIGDSWIEQGEASILAASIHARIPGAVVEAYGTGGQTSSQVLARFDADIPNDADFIILNEPGVNDITVNAPGIDVSVENLAVMTRIARKKGAQLIWTGLVPMSDWVRGADYNQRLAAIVGDGRGFPAAAPDASWSLNVKRPAPTSIGYGPALSASLGSDPFSVGQPGARNTAAGVTALDHLTTAVDDTAFGYQALGTAVAAAYDCTAIGSRALANCTREQNTAIGANAGRAVTTAIQNVFIGDQAGYKDELGSTTNATVDGSEQVIIGHWAMGTASGYLQTAIGSRAEARNIFATAIGAGTKATHQGSVAIGIDSSGTSATSAASNFINLGTSLHTIHLTGKVRIDRNQTTVGAAGGASALPATPTKYASIWGGDGVEYVMPLYAKS